MIRSLAILFLTTTALTAQPAADRQEWQQLFNGKDLTGWIPKITGFDVGGNYGNTFRVENGVMKVVYEKDKYPEFANRFGHIFYNKKFSYYRIAVEYRFVGEQAGNGPAWAIRNSGIMIHCQPPETMGKNQDFPISIEVQLLGGNGKDKRSTANMCSPGTNIVRDGKLFTAHCWNSDSETYHGEQWVRVEAEVLGSETVKHFANGKLVMQYEKPQVGGGNVSNFDPAAKQDGKLLTEGYISLQSESHPVEFRKVELLNLEGCMDSKAKNYKSYFVHSLPGACVR